MLAALSFLMGKGSELQVRELEHPACTRIIAVRLFITESHGLELESITRRDCLSLIPYSCLLIDPAHPDIGWRSGSPMVFLVP